MTRTRIDAGTIVAFQQDGHRILRDGCIVLEGNRIEAVAPSYDGPVDEVIDARDRLVTPGYINTHVHLAESPLDKSFLEDNGRRQFSMTGLAEMLPIRSAAIDAEGARASVAYSMAELIRTGTTTFMEIGVNGDDVVEAATTAGLRAYVAESYRSGRWLTRDGKRMEYEWDEAAGERGLEAALDFIDRIDGAANDRIRGYLSPAQVDTCTEELLRASKAAADERQVPLALHTSQSVFEFDEMVQRHGMTPIEWLESIGFLGEWNILGHAILTAGHSWVQFQGNDLAILAAHRASIAHATWVFARRGIVMESYPRYLAAGVNVCLGTDTAPQSMIEALRWAAVLGKVMSRDAEQSTAADVFNSATLRAAAMLHRDDLGRIAPGAKADLLFWDMDSLFMVPLRDPIKNLVYSATSQELADVMIDGAWVMRDRAVLHVDEAAVTRDLQWAGERMWAAIGPGGWVERTADEWAPQTFADFVPAVG
jgi:5-methylthioadenosine/S-adenosylhomocysteine deaminase